MFLIIIYACGEDLFHVRTFEFLIGVSCFHGEFIYMSLGSCHVNVRPVCLIIVRMILITFFVI